MIVVFVAGILLTSCRAAQTTTPATSGGPTALQAAGTATVASTAKATVIPPTPTATPEPLALRVDGEGVTVAEYQAELTQLQQADKALGKTATADEEKKQVLDDLTDTLLLAQGAAQGGYKADDAALKDAISRLTTQLGSEQALKDWIAQHGYTDATFRSALARQMAAAWQRDQLSAGVPTVAEQVHARQILTIDENIANKAYELVKIPGTNFAAYAYQYDPQTGGDLGWFPRGYLTQTEVEAAAFTLQPGEISPVVKSQIGYHILQVIAREPSRPISPEALRVLQHKAIDEWLKGRRDSSKIEILLP